MAGSRNRRRPEQHCTLLLPPRKDVLSLGLPRALPASSAQTGFAADVGPSLDSAFGSARSQLERLGAVFAT